MKGLHDEIRSTVQAFWPTSVADIFSIATLKEYLMSFEAKQISPVVYSSTVSSIDESSAFIANSSLALVDDSVVTGTGMDVSENLQLDASSNNFTRKLPCELLSCSVVGSANNAESRGYMESAITTLESQNFSYESSITSISLPKLQHPLTESTKEDKLFPFILCPVTDMTDYVEVSISNAHCFQTPLGCQKDVDDGGVDDIVPAAASSTIVDEGIRAVPVSVSSIAPVAEFSDDLVSLVCYCDIGYILTNGYNELHIGVPRVLVHLVVMITSIDTMVVPLINPTSVCFFPTCASNSHEKTQSVASSGNDAFEVDFIVVGEIDTSATLWIGFPQVAAIWDSPFLGSSGWPPPVFKRWYTAPAIALHTTSRSDHFTVHLEDACNGDGLYSFAHKHIVEKLTGSLQFIDSMVATVALIRTYDLHSVKVRTNKPMEFFLLKEHRGGTVSHVDKLTGAASKLVPLEFRSVSYWLCCSVLYSVAGGNCDL